MGTAPSGWQAPKTDWTASDPVGDDDLNRIEGDVNAVELGSRDIDQSQAPSSSTGYLRQFLDWFANRIKAITGKANWWTNPAMTLQDAYNHKENTSNPHNVTLTVLITYQMGAHIKKLLEFHRIKSLLQV